MAKITVQLEIPQTIAHNKKLKQLLLKAASDAIKEMAVLRLCEEGVISLSLGAKLLEISLYDFIILSGKRGVPYFLTKEEWEQYVKATSTAAKDPRPAKRGRRKQ